MSAKMIISPRYKPFILIKADFTTWIKFCMRNNIILDCKTVKTKARDLYETFSSNEIKNDMPKRRMLSQTLIVEEESKTAAFKAHNLPECQLTTCKSMGTLLNSGLIYKTTISNNLKPTSKNLIPVQSGWAWNHLDHMLNIAVLR